MKSYFPARIAKFNGLFQVFFIFFFEVQNGNETFLSLWSVQQSNVERRRSIGLILIHFSTCWEEPTLPLSHRPSHPWSRSRWRESTRGAPGGSSDLWTWPVPCRYGTGCHLQPKARSWCPLPPADAWKNETKIMLEFQYARDICSKCGDPDECLG